MPNKLVYGDQIQVRLDPKQLEAKNRREWGHLYLDKQAEKARMLLSASALGAASAISFFAAMRLESVFLLAGLALGGFALKGFFDYGYKKGVIDDWESKIMVRIDK
ncbi:MAG: hypothetical protein NTW59_02340 [Candidatus Diapherotrites archaeon]|nr:hypothetical protein [Candidatus Diapherotrites archaeon]